MSYTKKFNNIYMEISEVNKNLWMAQNPKLSIGYTAPTYEEVIARVEEEMEKNPQNFIEKTDAEMHGMTEEEYESFVENQQNLIKQMKGEI